MHQYALTDEQEALRQTVRRLAAEKVAPGALQRDHRKEYPWDMLALLRDNELLGLVIPPEYGGSGAGLLEGVLVVEELTRICYNTSYLLILTWGPAFSLLDAGTPAQKRELLPKLVRGEVGFATACTEPSGGSDVAGILTRAERDGDGWVITGTKNWSSNSPVADYLIVFAKTNPSQGPKGISAFLVPRAAPGVTVGKHEDKLGGGRAIPTAEVSFDHVRVPYQSLIGEEGRGFVTAVSTFTKLRPLIGGRALGLAQGALDHAVDYAKQRVCFGQVIAEYQGLQWMLADMAMQVEAARQLVYRAAALIDQGVSTKDATPYVAMAKCFSTDVAMRVTVDAAQVFGAYGVSAEYPMERYLRDAKILQIIEGTNQIQRNLIARALLA